MSLGDFIVSQCPDNCGKGNLGVLAALATTPYGRGFLILEDAAAALAYIGAVGHSEGDLEENYIVVGNGGSDEKTSEWWIDPADETLYGPDGANPGSGGYLILKGGSNADTDAGYLDLSGGSGAHSQGGIITAVGGSSAHASGGTINLDGGALSGGSMLAQNGGGTLNMSGDGVTRGGNITTRAGGGEIDTTGTGFIEFGVAGTRTTLGGTATADRTQDLPDNDGLVIVIDALGGSDVLIGWDDADALAVQVNIGSGLSYDHATHTLSATGGGGAVSSVSNSDGTLTISPTTGAVVASIDLTHPNTWTGLTAVTVSSASAALTLQNTSTGSALLCKDTVGTQTMSVSSGGLVSYQVVDTNTASAPGMVTYLHNLSSGTAAAGIGITVTYKTRTTGVTPQNQATEIVTWVDATNVSRKARQVFNIYDTAAREAVRLEANGSNPMIGVLGASASPQLASPDLGALVTTFGFASGTPTFAFANCTGTVAYTQIAAMTSAQFAGIISDETGSGKVVFSTAPTFDSTITVGTAGGTTGAILLNGTTSGTVTVSVAAAAGTWTMYLPTADGSGSNLFMKTNGSGQLNFGSAVTSVALTAPSEISVSGSPVTTTGTLALTWANQPKNVVFAGPSSGSAATPSFRALAYDDLGPANVTSGVYTPTLTNTTNVTSSTAFQCQYSRNGSVVTVSGKFSMAATTGAAATIMGISLPIASNFGAKEDCGGCANSNTLRTAFLAINADATNDRAQVDCIAPATASQDYAFIFAYRVI